MSADEGRYSKVSRRKWNDARYLTLSAPAPNGQTLFDRLLTGPELSNIPGLFQAWSAGLAQAMRWPLKGFQKAMGEVLQSGLARHDVRTGLWWLPNSIKHNAPESPNVIRSWKDAWKELPECELRDEAETFLMAWAEAKGEPWAKAFAEVIGKGSAKPSGKASGQPSPNQEQEQEQEQEQDVEGQAPATPTAPEPRSRPRRAKVASRKPPDNWQPNADHAALALEHRKDLARETAKFRDHEFKRAYSDWDATFRNWLRSDFGGAARNAPTFNPFDRVQQLKDAGL